MSQASTTTTTMSPVIVVSIDASTTFITLVNASSSVRLPGVLGWDNEFPPPPLIGCMLLALLLCHSNNLYVRLVIKIDCLLFLRLIMPWILQIPFHFHSWASFKYFYVDVMVFIFRLQHGCSLHQWRLNCWVCTTTTFYPTVILQPSMQYSGHTVFGFWKRFTWSLHLPYMVMSGPPFHVWYHPMTD